MVHALSILGDVFWILGLALMCAMSWSAWKRIPGDVSVPVLWRDGAPTWRTHRLPALWLLPTLLFAAGVWLKFESRAGDLDLMAALVVLGARATIAPMVAIWHLARVRRAMETLAGEGQLRS